MTSPLPDTALFERQTQALLDLVEAERQQQCSQALAEAHGRAAAQRALAMAEARRRLRQLFAEQRTRQHEVIAAAQARLATQRRLHEQQRTAALLRLAWQQLPAELLALWQQPATRAAWIQQVLTAALAHLPPGAWRILCAADGLPELARALAGPWGGAGMAAAAVEPDATLAAGLKVVADGNVIDGTLAALLADRADFEARLLRRLEARP